MNEQEDTKRKLNRGIVSERLKKRWRYAAAECAMYFLFFGILWVICVYGALQVNLLLLGVVAVTVVVYICLFWRRVQLLVITYPLVKGERFRIVKDTFSHASKDVFISTSYKNSIEGFFNVPFLQGKYSYPDLYCFHDYGTVITDYGGLPYATSGTPVYLVVLDIPTNPTVGQFYDARFYELEEE